MSRASRERISSPVHARSSPILLRASGKRLTVRFNRGWLEENHLTRADLERERAWLRAAGVKLRVRYQEDSESSRSSTVCAETAASPACG